MVIAEILFWFFVLALVYTYIGYGILMSLLVRSGYGRKRPPLEAWTDGPPHSVLFIITAFNEEAVIAEKIRNSLSLHYPQGRLRICVNADGSTDETASIAAQHEGVLVLHQMPRLGKAAAMNRAVELAAPHDILVFSDANTMLGPEALLLLVRHYSDPAVGAVSGEKMVSPGKRGEVQAVGESLYWRYESWMKALDARYHSLVGAAGEFLSVKRALYRQIPSDTISDDLFLSLDICRQGHVVDYEPAAVAMEEASPSLSQEWERKVRIGAGAFQALARSGSSMLPWPDPKLWLQFMSRRFMRWVVCPLALPLLLILNVLLACEGGAHAGTYQVLLVLHLGFHVLALAGGIFRTTKGGLAPMFQLPFYFLFMHYSLWAGFFRWVRGGQSVAWSKASRSPETI